MAKILGIYGSPREHGNSDILLDRALEGAKSAGAEISTIAARDLNMTRGCLECYSCEKTGQCVVQDDMQRVYPLLLGSDAILLASPIFFYGLSAQAKAIIDRCQCRWCANDMERRAGRKVVLDQGHGYLIAVGATSGKNVFAGAEWTAKYFFSELRKTYEGGLLVRGVDGKGEVLHHPDHLQAAYNLGVKAAQTLLP